MLLSPVNIWSKDDQDLCYHVESLGHEEIQSYIRDQAANEIQERIMYAMENVFKMYTIVLMLFDASCVQIVMGKCQQIFA